ncbi:FecR family protein [Bacteroides faecium]|uniref:FecR family protein n=1 Tax=Bacteroides faecium TaxID=2715212 RepID=A0A6H0KSQ8_9BACE|nr:FecR family protein [Bacteroides faecium]QIU96382.1 FecR family protein [Bacteroides faecium]
MEKNEVNRLIKGLLADKLDWDEKKKLSQHKLIEERMKRQWKHTTSESSEQEMKERIWQRLENCRKATQTRTYTFSFRQFLVAASILLFTIGGSLWLMKHYANSPKPEYINFTAEKALLYILPDSSHVWMQPKSRICYAKDFEKQREVWLKGEALFDVTKGKKNNFRVHIPKAYIEVKGTSFSVKNKRKDKNEIILYEGKIDFNIKNASHSISLKPKDKIIYNPETTEIEIETVNHTRWENGRYLFTDITLEELVEIINQKYTSRLVLAKEINKQYKYTGSLNYDEQLEDVIKKICYSMSLKAEKKGEEILIH